MYVHIYNLDNSNNYNYNSINNNVILEPDPNKPMCFANSKTDDEIIYGSKYKFNYSIEILINNSDNTRLAKNNKKQGTKIIPRRQNAWILYRRDKSLNPEFIGLKSALVSKEISKMWNKEEKGTIELFEALARKATEIHKKKYGENYKYKPRFLKKLSKNIQKKHKNKKVKSAQRKNEKEKIMKERVRNHQNKESLSGLTIIEERFPPTPLTSSPTTPTNMEFEPELEINAEQLPPTPAASSPATPSFVTSAPATPSSLESLPELLINAEQNFFPTLAIFSPLSEELSPDLAMNVDQTSPSTPSSLEFEQPSPEVENNTEQLLPTPAASTPTTPLPLEFEQLSELLINAEQNLFPTLEISSPSLSEELLPDLTTMSAEQLLLNPTFLPATSEFEEKLPEITINTDPACEMSSPTTSLSFEFEELLELSHKLVINATNKEEFSPSSVATLLAASSTLEIEELLSNLSMNMEQEDSLSSAILNSIPFLVFKKLLSEFMTEQTVSNCHPEAISSSLRSEESNLSNTTESEAIHHSPYIKLK